MSLLRRVGPRTTIARGATQRWGYDFTNQVDVGLQIAGPDFADLDSNLVAFDQGIEFHVSGGVTYHVKIRNEGFSCVYKLQIGGFE
jgi:hypothetical protein